MFPSEVWLYLQESEFIFLGLTDNRDHNVYVVCCLGLPELEQLLVTLRSDTQYVGSLLVRELKRRDALISRRDKQNDVITAFLQALSEKRSKYYYLLLIYTRRL